MEPEAPKTCPKCGAGRVNARNWSGWYSCESVLDSSDQLDQSERCKVVELEATVARLTQERDAALAKAERLEFTIKAIHASMSE